MDRPLVGLEVEVTGYVQVYKDYLTAGVNHLSMDFNSIFEEVQRRAGKVGYDSEEHSFLIQGTYHHYPEPLPAYGPFTWTTIGLPKDYPCHGKKDKKNYTCNGTCVDMFRSPHEAFTVHRIPLGDCGKHSVTDATRHLHAKLKPLDRCPHIQTLKRRDDPSKGMLFQCTLTREFVCDAPHSDHHPWHDFYSGVGDYPPEYMSVSTNDGGEQSDAGDGSPDCDTCTSTSECSTCSSDGGESTSTDGSHDCASCTSTSECSACVATETSTSASETNTETTPASTSTPTAPGLYPVGASYATVNSQQMPSLAPGDTHTAKLITKAGGYAIVHWYLLPPGDSRTYGDELFPTTYAQGPTVGTEVSFNFTIPSGARGGVYKLTAYIYPHSSAADQTCYEYSYYIYVS